MYHELTKEQVRRRSVKRLTAAFLVITLALACVFAYNQVSATMREQGAASVREAVLDAAKQCCAVEGAYPSSITHLEESYGLTINRDDYIVTYEAFADNVAPSVVVVAR